MFLHWSKYPTPLFCFKKEIADLSEWAIEPTTSTGTSVAQQYSRDRGVLWHQVGKRSLNFSPYYTIHSNFCPFWIRSISFSFHWQSWCHHSRVRNGSQNLYRPHERRGRGPPNFILIVNIIVSARCGAAGSTVSVLLYKRM